MFEGGEITLALVTTVTAVAIVFGLIVWNHRSMKRTLQCHSCRHPFHQSHPDRCIECGKRWRNKPFLSLWITFPLITIIVISGLTYPACSHVHTFETLRVPSDIDGRACICTWVTVVRIHVPPTTCRPAKPGTSVPR